MKSRYAVGFLFACLLSIFCLPPGARAAEHPKKPITIKLEGGKMPPVVFSHDIHVEKQKIDCVKCHHKDPQNPKVCTTCHGKEAKDGQPSARDAFHKRCQGCHKEMVEKGLKPPTKCMECHKK
jgi:hypothetical protein